MAGAAGSPGRSSRAWCAAESRVVNGGCTATVLLSATLPGGGGGWGGVTGRAGDPPGRGRRGRGDSVPVPLPQVPAAGAGRSGGAGPRGARADRRDPGGPAGARVPVLWPARDREDVHSPHLGEDGQLRAGADGRALR